LIEINITKFFKNKRFRYFFKSEKKKLVIFGHSGAGKSNLVKMIAGFYPPDEGFININGVTFFKKGEINLPIDKRRVGYIPQEYTLFPHLTVLENVLYGLKVSKIKLDKTLFNFLINTLEIEDYLNKYPSILSGGQKQRVAIARALMINPNILLFDEPFSSLDKPIKERLIEVIDILLKQIDKPAIFITHDIDDAYLLGEDVVIIKDGVVIEYGEKAKIFNKPQYVETAKLLNFKNLWKVEGIEDNYLIVNNERLFTKNIQNGIKFVGIRPENVMIVRRDAKEEKENQLEVVVRWIKKLSGFCELKVEHNKLGSIFIKLPEHAFNKLNIREDENIKISLKSVSLITMNEVIND